MKKRLLAMISVVGLVSVLAFAGCSGSDQDISKVKIIEEEVVVKAAEKVDKASEKKSDLQVLEEKVDKAVKNAKNAKPENDVNKNRDKFFELKSEMEHLDAELEVYEEELEGKYYSGKLSKDKYRAMNLEIDKLEDKLDLAEDELEYKFGIDD